MSISIFLMLYSLIPTLKLNVMKNKEKDDRLKNLEYEVKLLKNKE